MLFNSFVFVLFFLPVALLGFYALARRGSRIAVAWLVLASIVFYGWWNALYVLLLAASVVGNFVIGLLLQAAEKEPPKQTAILAAGICANLALLFYYKYVSYFFVVLSRIGIHVDIDTSGILLPLGISFFTFTQIGYLIDCRAGIARDRRLLDYALFVTFFPHLIAGPILHHREMMPQFEDPRTFKFQLDHLAVGLTIFAIGLSKKVLIADQLAPAVNLGYQGAYSIGLLPAWGTALGYSMQLYFDFSGYSDMAIGLARMFGVRFPANFNSPYKATNIIDFWQRWHMTLTRYLTLYLYNPVALWMTRRLAAGGLAIGAQGVATPIAFAQLIAFPTLFTMLIAGIWHGAGTPFAIFGLLHGLYLTVNHAWNIFGPKRKSDCSRVSVWTRIVLAWLLTYGAVLLAQVFFRAPYTMSAVSLLQGMVGMRGLTFGTTPIEDTWTILQISDLLLSPTAWTRLVICFAIVLAAPNTVELLARYSPVLGRVRINPSPVLLWKPSLAWGISVGALAAVSFLLMSGATEFLYFQF